MALQVHIAVFAVYKFVITPEISARLPLQNEDMRLSMQNNLFADAGMRLDADLISHRAVGHKQRRSLPVIQQREPLRH